MHARGHHLHTRLQARRNHGLVAVCRSHHHRLQLNRAGCRIKQPHCRALGRAGSPLIHTRLARLAQRRGRQLDHRHGHGRHLQRLRLHRGAQWRHAVALHRHLDLIRARGRVRAGGDLTHHAIHRRQPFLPGCHLELLANLDQRLPVLRHAEDNVARAILGDAHYGRARVDHLTRLGLYRRNHTRHIGQQPRIGLLIGLGRQLGLGLVQRGLRGLQVGFAPLHLSAADEILSPQLLIAAHIGRRQVALRCGRNHLRPRCLGTELIVTRIELGQQLAGLHMLT